MWCFPVLLVCTGDPAQRGENYVRQLGVDLEGLFSGYTKTVKLHKRIICPTCNGVGTPVSGPGACTRRQWLSMQTHIRGKCALAAHPLVLLAGHL